MSQQLDKLRKILKEQNIDIFMASSPIIRNYLSNFKGYGGYIIVGEDIQDVVTDFCHYEQALIEAPDFQLVKITSDYNIVNYIAEKGFKRVAFEEQFMTVANYMNLKNNLPDVEFVPGSAIVNKIRQIKTPEELEGYRKACEVTCAIQKEFFDNVKIGMSEIEMNTFIHAAAKRHGAEGHMFEPITLIGPNASLCHGIPTERRLQEGDFVLLDMGVIYNGYMSDVTRTAVMGKASDKQKEIYEIVRYAQKECIKRIKIGMTAYEAHMIAQDIIAEAGYGECFQHALGHGFKDDLVIRGNEIDKNTILEENMVFTVEPGIYIPGFGGVRIEDDVVLTKEGCVSFCTYGTDLRELEV